jgi:hypothetical protein
VPLNEAVAPEVRQAALDRAAEVGSQQAGLELGVKPATIRAWRARAKAQATTANPQAQAVTAQRAVEQALAIGGPVDGETDAQSMRRMIVKLRRVSEQGLDQLSEVVGSARSPQSLAVAVGILTDKALLLTAELAAADERQQSIGAEQARTIFAVFQLALDSLGLPCEPGSAAMRVIADVLRQGAGAGGVWSVSPAVVGPARAEVRASLRRELEPAIRREIEVEVRARVAHESRVAAVSGLPRLALLPAGGSCEAEAGSLAPPVARWVVTLPDRPQRPVVASAPSSPSHVNRLVGPKGDRYRSYS